jgi:hypothetical protein
MTRRDLFKALAAAPVVVAAAEAVPTPHEMDAMARAFFPRLGRLHPKQMEVWRALHDPNVRAVLFSGGRACGKTHLALTWADEMAFRSEHHVVIGERFWLDEWRHYESSRLPQRHFRHYGTAGDARGLAMTRFIVVRANEITRHDFRFILSGMRPVEQGKMLLTAVPGGVGMPWLRDLFPRVGWNGPHLYHVNAAMTDNPYLIGKWR